MMRTTSWLEVVAALLAVAGCATAARQVVQQDGVTLDEQLWTQDAAAISNRASFEFNCPKQSLHLQVIEAGIHMDTADSAVRRATEVGVDACGKRAVYVYMNQNGTWVMNTASK